MKKTIIIAVIVAFFATGCMSISRGQKFTLEDIDSLKPGVSTLDDVIVKLGKPAATSYKEDGTIGRTWFHYEGNSLNMRSIRTGIRFSKDGIMLRVVETVESQP